MKPICATVDQASATLMLIRVPITSVATTTDTVATAARSQSAAGACASSGQKRISTKPPRLTTPACSNDDTGVGASMTWTSHPCSGTCAHFRAAVTTSSTSPACASAGTPCPAAAAIMDSSDSVP